ncbi:MAG: AtpZ/AtpI family protein [Candidatus Melainabacteria bacterium]|nr:AtpZ/AtpI family protein [Candidatus Melainabacteria bacterium]MBI3308485.1 AtpZ/AtpI family protein [Candidatus Melainabacteria bacterium]
MALLYDLIFGVFILTAIAATVGNYLDKKFNTSPWLAIIFGIIAIIFGLYRLVTKALEIGNSKQGQNDRTR